MHPPPDSADYRGELLLLRRATNHATAKSCVVVFRVPPTAMPWQRRQTRARIVSAVEHVMRRHGASVRTARRCITGGRAGGGGTALAALTKTCREEAQRRFAQRELGGGGQLPVVGDRPCARARSGDAALRRRWEHVVRVAPHRGGAWSDDGSADARSEKAWPLCERTHVRFGTAPPRLLDEVAVDTGHAGLR